MLNQGKEKTELKKLKKEVVVLSKDRQRIIKELVFLQVDNFRDK